MFLAFRLTFISLPSLPASTLYLTNISFYRAVTLFALTRRWVREREKRYLSRYVSLLSYLILRNLIFYTRSNMTAATATTSTSAAQQQCPIRYTSCNNLKHIYYFVHRSSVWHTTTKYKEQSRYRLHILKIWLPPFRVSGHNSRVYLRTLR